MRDKGERVGYYYFFFFSMRACVCFVCNVGGDVVYNNYDMECIHNAA